MLASIVLLWMMGSASLVDPCDALEGEDERLECAFTLADAEWDRAGTLLELSRAVASKDPVQHGYDVVAELDQNHVEWEDYADGACAAVAHRAGPSESHEGYYAFFQCRRQMNFERSAHLWREYLEGSGEARPSPILDWEI